MVFGASYEGTVFFIGMTMILFALSESKMDQTPGQLSKPPNLQYLLSTNSILEPIANGKTPTALGTTSTTVEIVPVSQDPAPAPQNPSNVPQPKPTLQPSFSRVDCNDLKQPDFAHEIIDILSPEIFSLADPFQYLVDKTSKLRRKSMVWMMQTLNNHLQNDQLPRCYVPYAKALSSLLRCWQYLDSVQQYIYGIGKLLSKNDADLSFLPPDISLPPQLLELFSGEIFGDPASPQGLFYKLIDMPKNDLLNLEARLQKFIEQSKSVLITPTRRKYYTWYANSVWKLLQNESDFDDLKRCRAEIQHLANSGQFFSPAESTV